MSNKKISIIIIFVTVAVVIILLKTQTGDIWQAQNYFKFSTSDKNIVSFENESKNNSPESKLSKSGFEITLPQGSTFTEFEELGGETTIIKNEKIKIQNEESKNFEMQIFQIPFEENIFLTEERIKQDIPDIKIQNAEKINFDGVDALAFIDADRNTREVWLTKDGFLYQISVPAEFDSVTGSILQSWRWRID